MPIAAAWDFFSLASNLEKITPPKMKFRTTTDLGDGRLFDGMKIGYKLTPLLNIPVRWETEILQVNAPYKFMDKQHKGPYALWEHTHTFMTVEGGVKMTDKVDYALPLGWLGVFMHAIVVKRKLTGIFDFREATLKRLFGEYRHSQG